MCFHSIGLDPVPFHHLYGLPESELAAPGVLRHVADAKPVPDRVKLRDVPEPLRLRLIALRAFDGDQRMVDADGAAGQDLEGFIEQA